MAPPTYVVDHTGTAKCSEPPLPATSGTCVRLVSSHHLEGHYLVLQRSYELMRQTSSLLRIGVSTLSPAVLAVIRVTEDRTDQIRDLGMVKSASGILDLGRNEIAAKNTCGTD